MFLRRQGRNERARGERERDRGEREKRADRKGCCRFGSPEKCEKQGGGDGDRAREAVAGL